MLTSHLDSLVEVRVKELRELFSKLRGFLNGLDQSKFRLTLRETSINEAQRQEKVIDFTYNHKGKKLSGSFVLESGTFEWRYALGGFSERTSIIKHLVFNNIVGAVDGVDDAFVGRCLDGQRLGRSPDCEPAPYLAVFAQHLDRRKYHGTLNYIEHCRDEAFEGFIKMMVPKAKALK